MCKARTLASIVASDLKCVQDLLNRAVRLCCLSLNFIEEYLFLHSSVPLSMIFFIGEFALLGDFPPKLPSVCVYFFGSRES
jgi:hypothetical protein